MSPEGTAERPNRSPVRRRSGLTRMPADAAARQGRLTQRAWAALGGRDAVVAFLNTHHEGLGGRPIDLAIADAAGLAAVEAVLDGQRPAAEAVGG